MNERLWELLAKYWADRISSEEKAEMERLLLEHPDHWLKTGLMQQIAWRPEQMLSAKQADRICDRIVGSGPDPQSKKHTVRKKAPVHYWRLAIVTLAILLISTFSLVLYRNHQGQSTLLWQQVSTTNGMKTTLRLADGSELWLNAGSTLRYPENFNEKTREVYLSGEAYFKIAHRASKPFVIHTHDMDIKVLGTEFDVRAYADEGYSETSLIKGAVEVTVNREKQRQQIFLKPKQKIIVQKSSMEIKNMEDPQASGLNLPVQAADTATRDVVLEPISIVDGDIIPETAWKENTLLFEDEPLQSLARRLERWYGVKIVIRDAAFAQQRFTGRADNVSLERLLHILQMIKPFKYAIHDKQVIIQ